MSRTRRIYNRPQFDLPLLGLYDSANDPDPVEDPDWARFLLGDGWIAIYEGVCN